MKRNADFRTRLRAWFAGSRGCATESPHSALPASEQTFIEHSYDAGHVHEYMGPLDYLQGVALSHIYDNEDHYAASQGSYPLVDAGGGIRMIYTVARFPSGLHHCFSTSRAPYLATAFARFLVALACERFGLPTPDELLVSPRFVYHANWYLTEAEHAAAIVGIRETRQRTLEDVLRSALTRRDMRLRRLSWEETRLMGGGPSN